MVLQANGVLDLEITRDHKTLDSTILLQGPENVGFVWFLAAGGSRGLIGFKRGLWFL